MAHLVGTAQPEYEEQRVLRPCSTSGISSLSPFVYLGIWFSPDLSYRSLPELLDGGRCKQMLDRKCFTPLGSCGWHRSGKLHSAVGRCTRSRCFENFARRANPGYEKKAIAKYSKFLKYMGELEGSLNEESVPHLPLLQMEAADARWGGGPSDPQTNDNRGRTEAADDPASSMVAGRCALVASFRIKMNDSSVAAKLQVLKIAKPFVDISVKIVYLALTWIPLLLLVSIFATLTGLVVGCILHPEWMIQALESGAMLFPRYLEFAAHRVSLQLESELMQIVNTLAWSQQPRHYQFGPSQDYNKYARHSCAICARTTLDM
jgi:phage gpG-like protein